MTDVSDLAETLKTYAYAMAPITLRASPDEERSQLYRDMSAWMHEAAVLMNAASAALTAAAQVRERAGTCPVCGGQHSVGVPCTSTLALGPIPIYSSTEDTPRHPAWRSGTDGDGPAKPKGEG